jgi:SAM-dependent methyltransferase
VTKPSLQAVVYPESSVGGFTDIDGTIAFYLRVNALLRRSDVVLDVGCGRGEYADDPVAIRSDLRILRGKCARVVGIDPDEIGSHNPCVDEFRLMSSAMWPVDDESVDLCLADSVLEHVRDPSRFFAECQRVMRTGGILCIRTPNALGYATAVSRLIPSRLHPAVLRRVQAGREARDVFPTHYRCNTTRRLRLMMVTHGFGGCVYGYGPEPAYLDFSKTAYALGAIWTRLAPRDLQAALFAFGRRLD